MKKKNLEYMLDKSILCWRRRDDVTSHIGCGHLCSFGNRYQLRVVFTTSTPILKCMCVCICLYVHALICAFMYMCV
jgi:hypothetical protein